MHVPKHLCGDPAPTITETAFLVTNASADATDGEEQFLIKALAWGNRPRGAICCATHLHPIFMQLRLSLVLSGTRTSRGANLVRPGY